MFGKKLGFHSNKEGVGASLANPISCPKFPKQLVLELFINVMKHTLPKWKVISHRRWGYKIVYARNGLKHKKLNVSFFVLRFPYFCPQANMFLWSPGDSSCIMYFLGSLAKVVGRTSHRLSAPLSREKPPSTIISPSSSSSHSITQKNISACQPHFLCKPFSSRSYITSPSLSKHPGWHLS